MDALQAIEEELAVIHRESQSGKDAAAKAHYTQLQELFKRRYQLTTGSSDPTAEEIGDADTTADTASNSGDSPDAGTSPKGVPNFWLTALCNEDVLAGHITARDAEVLQYLEDVRLRRTWEPAAASVELLFRPNPCLANRRLSHGVRIEKGRPVEDVTDPDWRPGRDPTVREVLKKGGGGGKKGKKKGKAAAAAEEHEDPARRRVVKPVPSFFRLFGTSRLPQAPGVLPTQLTGAEQEAAEDAAEVLAALQHVALPEAASLFLHDPEKGSRLLGDDSDDEDDFGVQPLADTADLHPAVQRRVAALQHNQKDIDGAWRAHWQSLALESKAAADRTAPLLKERRALLADGQGVDNFWLKALIAGEVGGQAVHARDHAALAHLIDVRISGQEAAPGDSQGETFTMEFEFGANDFFEDAVLTKTLEFGARPKRPDRQPPLSAARQSGVRWKPGRDLTNSRGGSFFHLFAAGGAGKAFGTDDTEGAERVVELLQELRQTTVPHAASAYKRMASVPVATWSEAEESEPEDEDEGSDSDSGGGGKGDGVAAAAARAARREKKAAAAAWHPWLQPSSGMIVAGLVIVTLLVQALVLLEGLFHTAS